MSIFSLQKQVVGIRPWEYGLFEVFYVELSMSFSLQQNVVGTRLGPSEYGLFERFVTRGCRRYRFVAVAAAGSGDLDVESTVFLEA